MEITADQLQQLIETIRRDPARQTVRRMQRTPISDEEFIAGVLREEYGVTGIRRPPEYEVVVREYLPVEWHPRRGVGTVEPGRGGGSPVPPPAYQSQILADLDTLRRSPLAALVYIIARAAGQDNASAMNFARLAQAVAGLLMAARPLAFSRSISPSTGRPRDASLPRVAPAIPQPRSSSWAQQQLYQQDLQRRGLGERPAAGDRSNPPPSPHLRR